MCMATIPFLMCDVLNRLFPLNSKMAIAVNPSLSRCQQAPLANCGLCRSEIIKQAREAEKLTPCHFLNGLPLTQPSKRWSASLTCTQASALTSSD